MDYLQIFNLILFALMALVNAYWTWQTRKIQNDRDVIKALQLQISLKDEALKDMRDKKNELKAQYGHQLIINKKLEGELQTYKRFNHHAQVD